MKTSRANRKVAPRKQLVQSGARFLCLLLVCLLLGLLPGGYAQGATGLDPARVIPANKELPIYYQDYPGSMLGAALDNSFPYSDRIRLSSELSLHAGVPDLVLLLGEHQAYPSLRHSSQREQSAFKVLYRATLVIAYDWYRVRQEINSWEDFAAYVNRGGAQEVGLFIEPEYLLSSWQMASRDPQTLDRWYGSLASLHQQDLLKIYRGKETNTAWPLKIITGDLTPDLLPPILILWDYQAAQINIKLNQDLYNFHVPREGSLFVDYGLYGQGIVARDFLNLRISPLTEDLLGPGLLAKGYRLPDGSSASLRKNLDRPAWLDAVDWSRDYGYPPEAEYGDQQLRIKNYEQFNHGLLTNQSVFRREILGHSPYLPANPEEEHIAVSFFLPLFLLWIASIFFRLDDRSIRRSMGLLLFWLGTALVMQFVLLMYTNFMTWDILYYIRFLPYFGVLESWFFTGVSLASSQGIINRNWRRGFFLLSLVFYASGVAFIFNDLLGLSFSLNAYKVIVKLGPLGYVVIGLMLVLWLLGFALLLSCQAKIYRSTLMLPLLAFVLLLAANFAFFHYDAGLRSNNLDLINILGFALILELSIQTRLIPANSGYIKLFRYSPVNLRLWNEELTDIYPPEKDDIPRHSLTKLREEIKGKYLADLVEDKKAPFWQFWLWRKPHQPQLQENLRVPSVERNGLIYNVSQINGGYLIWEDDISDIQNLGQELSGLNNVLEQRAKLMAKERSIRSQYISMRVRQNFLNSIEESLASQLSVIRQSLAEIEKSQDRAFVRKELGRVKIMVSQCKRKSNLLVRGEETIAGEEVGMIFQEALQDASTAGVKALAVCRCQEPVPTSMLLLAYDYLQALLEKSVDLSAPSAFVNVQYKEGHLDLHILYTAQDALVEDFFVNLLNLDQYPRVQAQLQVSQDGPDHNIRLMVESGEEV
ncbi:MAG: hypothetical protein Q4D97_02210 [Eubacteriales bacterium]|nr:hypothetical protein [Eubacteriales bacterium]